MTFTSSGIVTTRYLLDDSGVTSVTYAIPASASPDNTFARPPLTSSSLETTFASAASEIPALSKICRA